jgi:hypothetical protein
VHTAADGVDQGAVDEPITAAVMALCNGCYELMTAMLLRFFSHTDESDAALRTLVGGAMGLMSGAVRPLGTLLTTLPARAGRGDATAGPSFEFSRSTYLVPHRRAAWMVLHERLVELAGFAGRIPEDGGPDLLTTVAAALSGLAQDLEPHLDGVPEQTLQGTAPPTTT